MPLRYSFRLQEGRWTEFAARHLHVKKVVHGLSDLIAQLASICEPSRRSDTCRGTIASSSQHSGIESTDRPLACRKAYRCLQLPIQSQKCQSHPLLHKSRNNRQHKERHHRQTLPRRRRKGLHRGSLSKSTPNQEVDVKLAKDAKSRFVTLPDLEILKYVSFFWAIVTNIDAGDSVMKNVRHAAIASNMAPTAILPC